ncbi:MPV17L (predicted) [Pycnogonum litorale]
MKLLISNTVLLARNVFKKNPLVVNVGIYGALFTSSELLQQTVSKKLLPKMQSIDNKNQLEIGSKERKSVDGYNWKSICCYAVYGTFLIGPALFFWYKFLDRKFPSSIKKNIAKKVFLDQFGFGLVSLGIFFSVMNIMEGKERPFDDVPEKWFKAFTMGACYWMPVQTVNFLILPPQYRVAYVGLMSFIWTNVLIYMRKS